MITRPRRGAGAALLAAVTAAGLASCGSAHAGQATPSAAARPPVPGHLRRLPGGSWAVLVMGGSAARHNNFWQVFVRPGQAGAWKLATPPGVASNGGITVAAEGGPALAAAIRPSQDLSFSPVASSSDNGAKWAQAGLLDAPLAGYPDALAAAPDGGLIALTRTGDVELRAHSGAAWTRLASAHTVAAAAGRGCLPAQLTSVAYSPSGAALVAGACTREGQAGIFRLAGGHWSRTGPALPAALARRDVEVLQMARAGRTVAALLAVGRGPDRAPARRVVQPGRHLMEPVAALPGRPGAAALGGLRQQRVRDRLVRSPLGRRWLARRPAVRRPGRVRQRARCGLAVPARPARRGVGATGRRGDPGRGPRRLRGPDGPGRPAVRLGAILRWFGVGPVAGHQRGHSLRLVRVRMVHQ